MRLYVNIDHVATVREARRTDEPDPVRAAAAAEQGGADGITVHLREDRRHIQDADVRALRAAVRSVLNLELGAAPEIVRISGRLKPFQATLVPERRREITTEGGLARGLAVHAGHGLTYDNVQPVAAIRDIEELNIGHSIVSNAIFVGMEAAVRRMRQLVDEARKP